MGAVGARKPFTSAVRVAMLIMEIRAGLRTKNASMMVLATVVAYGCNHERLRLCLLSLAAVQLGGLSRICLRQAQLPLVRQVPARLRETTGAKTMKPGYGFAYFRWRSNNYTFAFDETRLHDAIMRSMRRTDCWFFSRLQLRGLI